jgi:FKBP-type peptidyl-prolyl cis-trans isomerase SlyD
MTWGKVIATKNKDAMQYKLTAFSKGNLSMSQPRVISFHYTLTDRTGKTIDSSRGDEPLTYLERTGHIIPGLENEIAKLQVGDKKVIKVLAADAYGEVRSDLIFEVPHSQFPEAKNIKKGDQFRGNSEDGNDHHAPVFTVEELTATSVKLNGNHPLAGEDLSFDVEITAMRPATAEEVAHGHSHGEGGHHH